MRLSFRAGLLPLVAVSVVCGCSETVTPPGGDLSSQFRQSLAAGPAVFVMAGVEQQTTEPITTFDHMCSGVHIVQTRRDTLLLRADGTARRSQHIENVIDGVTDATSDLVLVGLWTPLTQANLRYYSDGPSIALTLTPPGGLALNSWMRVQSITSLTTLASLGGSCVGVPTDGREAEFSYTRR